MAYLNDCRFIGHTGQDMKVVNFPDGGKVGNCTLAITKKWKKEGVLQEKTTWLDLSFPAHIVDTAANLITKGRHLLVEGELETREYEKDGVKMKAFGIRVGNFQLLDKKPEEADQAQA